MTALAIYRMVSDCDGSSFIPFLQVKIAAHVAEGMACDRESHSHAYRVFGADEWFEHLVLYRGVYTATPIFDAQHDGRHVCPFFHTGPQRDVAFPGQTRNHLLADNVPGAKQESTGFEIDLMYQPTRNWQIMFSYANNDQEVVEALNTATIGQSTSGHIDSQFSVLTRYSFLDGGLDGLWLGLGFQAADGALQDYNGPGGAGRFNPSTLRAEVFAGYNFKLAGYDSSLQLNVKNITKQEEFFGWKGTGSASTTATERFEIPTKMRFSLTWGLEF